MATTNEGADEEELVADDRPTTPDPFESEDIEINPRIPSEHMVTMQETPTAKKPAH